MTAPEAALRAEPATACGIAAFVAAPGPVVDFAPGALERLGDHVTALGATRAVLVTDPGLRAVGIADAAIAALAAARIPVVVVDDVPGNPTTHAVEAGAVVVREAVGDHVAGTCVVALGGGSALDAAKGIALLAADPGLRATDPARRPGLPVVAVPTTAGTGAETNGFGVLEDPAARAKVYCGDASVTPRVAVLDPLLTHGLPPGATAATGVDALVHGVESLVSRGRSPLSEAFAAEAVRRAWTWLPVAVADGTDPRARAEMLVAAHLAGQALTRSGLGLVHGLGHALTAHTGTVHGRALAAVLPAVVAWSLDAEPDGWARVAGLLGVGVGALPDALAGRCADVGTPTGTGAIGVDPGLEPALAATALADPVGRNAPRRATRVAELADLFARSR